MNSNFPAPLPICLIDIIVPANGTARLATPLVMSLYPSLFILVLYALTPLLYAFLDFPFGHGIFFTVDYIGCDRTYIFLSIIVKGA